MPAKNYIGQGGGWKSERQSALIPMNSLTELMAKGAQLYEPRDIAFSPASVPTNQGWILEGNTSSCRVKEWRTDLQRLVTRLSIDATTSFGAPLATPPRCITCAFWAGVQYLFWTWGHAVFFSIVGSGTWSVIAGDPLVSGPYVAGPINGTLARFDEPCGVLTQGAISAVFICDRMNNVIRMMTYSPPNNPVTTLTGGFGFVNGPIASSKFTQPFGIAMDWQAGGTNAYVTEIDPNRIRRISGFNSPLTSTVFSYAGSTYGDDDNVSGIAAKFASPAYIAAHYDTGALLDRIYIQQEDADNIRHSYRLGTDPVIHVFGKGYPTALPETNHAYGDGNYSGTLYDGSQGRPAGMARRPGEDNIYFLDKTGNTIRKIALLTTGNPSSTQPETLYNPEPSGSADTPFVPAVSDAVAVAGFDTANLWNGRPGAVWAFKATTNPAPSNPLGKTQTGYPLRGRVTIDLGAVRNIHGIAIINTNMEHVELETSTQPEGAGVAFVSASSRRPVDRVATDDPETLNHLMWMQSWDANRPYLPVSVPARSIRISFYGSQNVGFCGEVWLIDRAAGQSLDYVTRPYYAGSEFPAGSLLDVLPVPPDWGETMTLEQKANAQETEFGQAFNYWKTGRKRFRLKWTKTGADEQLRRYLTRLFIDARGNTRPILYIPDIYAKRYFTGAYYYANKPAGFDDEHNPNTGGTGTEPEDPYVRTPAPGRRNYGDWIGGQECYVVRKSGTGKHELSVSRDRIGQNKIEIDLLEEPGGRVVIRNA